MNRNIKLTFALAVALACPVWSQAPASPEFAPLEQWKNAVIAGDPAALKALYSSDPAAEIDADGVKTDADGYAKFWTALKARGIKLEIVRETSHPDRHGIIFKAAVDSGANGKTINVTYAASWQKQGDLWRIKGAERTDAPALKQPADMKKEIYSVNADAHAELREAEERAVAGHKRLLLVFGANWCYDCHVLDLAFQGRDHFISHVRARGQLAGGGGQLQRLDFGPRRRSGAVGVAGSRPDLLGGGRVVDQCHHLWRVVLGDRPGWSCVPRRGRRYGDRARREHHRRSTRGRAARGRW